MKIHCKYDQLANPKELKNHPKNRNKHGQDQIERLAELYKYHGIRHPIIVSNLSGFIVAGHGRKLAAIRAGIKEMPVVFQDFDSSEAEYAFIQADNAIALWAELDMAGINSDIGDLGPDFDINMLGIQDFTLDVAEKEFEGDPDEVPEVVEPVAKLGQIYKLGEHRLMCGDSTSIDAVEKLMNGEKADMVFTDPPYGDNHAAMDVNPKMALVGKSIITKRHTIASDENLDFLPEAINTISTFLKEDATKLLFFKWSKWREVEDAAEAWGKPSAVCVWDREKIAAATFRFNPVHEFCFHWGSQADKRSTSNLTNVWRSPKESESKVFHPTVKPQAILTPAIEVCSDRGDSIIDCFGGSGSTLIACEKTNRKCFMMELDPHYVDVIIARWEKFTGKKAELLNG